jgi:dihydroorotate dehydrogenase
MLYGSPSVSTETFGIHFDNPVGLAAGMDKKGENIPNWQNLGFGWIEIGGVTLHPQEGNPKPRMFRSVKHQALINRMGFNNPGSEVMIERLTKQKAKRWASVPVAINLGKSKITPNEQAEQDYAGTLERLWEFADFFVVNVSSPNTPNLRELQADSELDRILTACNTVNTSAAQAAGTSPKPLLVKVSPDLADGELKAVADTAIAQGCVGIVATNTTTSRPAEDKVMNQSGGLSGKPLRTRSTEVIHLLYAHTNGKLPIVGVGGISDVESAWEKIGAGASLLQLYSALVFEGPSVNKTINKGLNRKLKEHGFNSLVEAVGHAHRS